MAEFPGLDDVQFILSTSSADPRAIYDAAAPRYEHFRELWMKLAGGDAERKMRTILGEILSPGQRVLDAGGGTGAVSREILQLEPAARITLLDRSLPMLRQASDVRGNRVAGDVMKVPWRDDRFDLVVSAWVIETVSDPVRAVAEYLRVLSGTGYLLYSFCSLPEGWFSRAGSLLLRKAVEHGFAGKFLAAEEIPWHDCERSRRWSFHGGLTTLVLLRKCCTVGPGVLPARMEDVPPTTS
ncbi:MAG: methyltransferase domain-containing protein [Acidobacteriota bacterium]|nr:methyltransferase domain-containing protein [Acidobacteriota bacterium]